VVFVELSRPSLTIIRILFASNERRPPSPTRQLAMALSFTYKKLDRSFSEIGLLKFRQFCNGVVECDLVNTH
jgi:hypothetical protein